MQDPMNDQLDAGKAALGGKLIRTYSLAGSLSGYHC